MIRLKKSYHSFIIFQLKFINLRSLRRENLDFRVGRARAVDQIFMGVRMIVLSTIVMSADVERIFSIATAIFGQRRYGLSEKSKMVNVIL